MQTQVGLNRGKKQGIQIQKKKTQKITQAKERNKNPDFFYYPVLDCPDNPEEKSDLDQQPKEKSLYPEKIPQM
ncbi:MAG: hypothetical protein WA705_28565 [Candidatus Ozemobacteraceae bacterium]